VFAKLPWWACWLRLARPPCSPPPWASRFQAGVISGGLVGGIIALIMGRFAFAQTHPGRTAIPTSGATAFNE